MAGLPQVSGSCASEEGGPMRLWVSEALGLAGLTAALVCNTLLHLASLLFRLRGGISFSRSRSPA